MTRDASTPAPAGPAAGPAAADPPGSAGAGPAGSATAGRPGLAAGFAANVLAWAALAVFTVLAGIGLAPPGPGPAGAVAGAVLAIGAAALLLCRRDRRYLLPGAVLATAGLAVIGNGNAADLGWFAVCLLGLWCGLTGDRHDALAYWLATLVLFAVQWLFVRADPGWGAWMGGTTLAVFAGLMIRRERDLVAQLREAQAGLADRARAEERNRIARELHDVIAHTLTVSLLHVSSARLAVEHGLDDAVQSLAEAERLGRESLDEVRTAVGMLREDAGGGRTAPLPDAGDLPGLIEQFRSAGGDVSLAVDGDTARLPATTGLAMYRILQEALTNAVKHAPGAHTSVHLAADGREARLTADTAAAPGTGTGFGLLNMRERAESVGGTLAAGPGGRGWLVQATFPVGKSRSGGDAR